MTHPEDPDSSGHPGIDLDEAIQVLRGQLARAHARGAGSDLQFPVRSVTVELKVMVSRTSEGKAAFRVPVVGLELGREGARAGEVTQTITLELGGPVNRDGVPQRVASSSDAAKG